MKQKETFQQLWKSETKMKPFSNFQNFKNETKRNILVIFKNQNLLNEKKQKETFQIHFRKKKQKLMMVDFLAESLPSLTKTV